MGYVQLVNHNILHATENASSILDIHIPYPRGTHGWCHCMRLIIRMCASGVGF